MRPPVYDCGTYEDVTRCDDCDTVRECLVACLTVWCPRTQAPIEILTCRCSECCEQYGRPDEQPFFDDDDE